VRFPRYIVRLPSEGSKMPDIRAVGFIFMSRSGQKPSVGNESSTLKADRIET
jgi:hypothetical protein